MISVYKLNCVANGKFYIGSSYRLARRIYDHLQALAKGIHSNSDMQNDYNIYGKTAFTFESICLCERDELFNKEQIYLDKYFAECPDMLYNKSKVAFGNSSKMLPHVKEALKNANTGRKATEETKAKMSAAHTGREITWADKISAANTGKVRTAEQNAANSAARKGVPTGRIGKPVRCVQTGVVYQNTVAAAEAVSARDFRSITRSIKSGYKCGGFNWEYA